MGKVQTERGWGIESKISYGFLFFFIFLVYIGIASKTYIQRFAETSRWVAHTHEVIGLLYKDLSLLNHMESAQRGFIISGDKQFIERRKQLMDELQSNLSLALQLTADNPLQQRQLKMMQKALAERQNFYDHSVEKFQRSGLAKLKQGSKDYLYLDQGQIMHIRDLVSITLDEEERLLNERNSLEQQHANEVLMLFSLLFIGVLAITPLIYWHIRRDLRLRRQLAHDQKRLTDILDASPDLIATANIQGDYVYLNSGGRHLLGIGEDEDILTQPISHMRPQWSIDLIQNEAIPAAIKTGLWVGETAFINRTGREIPVSQVNIRHEDAKGTTAYISTVARDIRDFKKIEHDLTQAALYDQTHSAILRLFNGNYDRSMILQGMLELLAKHHHFPVSAVYLYEEWSGTYRMDTAHAAPANIQKEFKYGEGLIGEAARENRTLVKRDLNTTSFLLIDSGLLSCQPEAIILCPVTYQDKRLAVIALASSQPVTERDEVFVERLAAQLGVALQNIQQYVDAKLLADQLRLHSEEISKKNVELEHAGRVKSEFLATMSHELRTPMNAVIGFSEILRDGLVGPLSEQQKEYVNDIYESGQHLLSLINDVLDLSKIEAGRMQLDAEMTDIAMLLQNSLSIVKEKAASQQVQLKLELTDDLGEAWLDPRKVKQIVYNLLSNAVKFTPPGGEVSLSAKLVKRADALAPTSESQGIAEMHSELVSNGTHFLQISVTDSGIGIAAEDLQRLFQPFVQIDSKLSRLFEGTGLGLAMVRKLADLHGGAVAVSSKPDAGSTFSVWLLYLAEPPVSSESKTAATNPAYLETLPTLMHLPQSDSPHVLVIEDDDRAADLMRLHLESNSFHVTRATTAEAAIVMIKNAPPDLITLDIMLPGMDGWEFLAQLKSQAQLANIPVVIVSIVADNHKGVALGAAKVLQKPVSAEELLTTISQLGFVKSYAGSQCGKILVVDDDPKAVNIIATYLEQAGYTVFRAYGGQEALRICREQSPPELIVLDLMMPELSGLDIANILKRDELTAQIPIVVITAKSITPIERGLLKELVLAVIEKSEFDHFTFINEVQRALRKTDKPITKKD